MKISHVARLLFACLSLVLLVACARRTVQKLPAPQAPPRQQEAQATAPCAAVPSALSQPVPSESAVASPGTALRLSKQEDRPLGDVREALPAGTTCASSGVPGTSPSRSEASPKGSAVPTSPPTAGDHVATPAPESKNSNNQTYREWLEHYSAWDKLDAVYAGQLAETPENRLQRARIAMQGAQPMQAVQILEQALPFQDNTLEKQRLWLGGQAHRALGDASRAVLWFSQAARLMDARLIREAFNTEPGLDLLWTDVWRKLFWDYIGNGTVSREGQALFLGTTLSQAETAWGQTPFWQAARLALDHSNANQADAAGTFPSPSDRCRIARYLAGLALDRPDADLALAGLSSEPLRLFWRACAAALDHPVPKAGPDAALSAALAVLDRDAYFRAGAFLRDALTRHRLLDFADNRRLEGGRAFTLFRGNLLVLPPEEAYRYFQQGREAIFMESGEPPAQTPALRFALAILAGDNAGARELWPSLDRSLLPPSLVLAGTILSDESAQAQTPIGPLPSPGMRHLVIALAEAGGSTLPGQAPFWTQAAPDQLAGLATRRWPLDPHLLLAHWTRQWSVQPSPELARRVAFLFPDAGLGVDCALYLARAAMGDNQLSLAEYYLDLVPEALSDPTLENRRLETLAEWQLAKKDMDGALASYQQLLARTPELSDTTRLKIAFLLQRKGHLKQGNAQLQQLWTRHETMPPAMQAEILFYMAEGTKAMGEDDTALDYYLSLAWQYPQETMWALTAMYRAASIYTERGQYEPARNLLRTVAKNAVTDKQRATAQARLEEVEAQLAKPTDLGSGAVPYPF